MKKIGKILLTILSHDLFLPVFLLVSYVLFLVLIRGAVPTSDEIFTSFGRLYHRFGYEIIFLSGLLEALVLINLFVPGSTAMILGVIYARAGETSLVEVIIFAILGTLIGYLIDYLLGYFGFSEILKKMKYASFVNNASANLHKYGNRAIIVGCVQSNIGSFVALSAGTVKFNPLRFLLLVTVSTIVWGVGWALLIFSFGDIVKTILKDYSFLLIVAIVAFWIITKLWKKYK